MPLLNGSVFSEAFSLTHIFEFTMTSVSVLLVNPYYKNATVCNVLMKGETMNLIGTSP